MTSASPEFMRWSSLTRLRHRFHRRSSRDSPTDMRQDNDPDATGGLSSAMPRLVTSLRMASRRAAPCSLKTFPRDGTVDLLRPALQKTEKPVSSPETLPIVVARGGHAAQQKDTTGTETEKPAAKLAASPIVVNRSDQTQSADR